MNKKRNLFIILKKRHGLFLVFLFVFLCSLCQASVLAFDGLSNHKNNEQSNISIKTTEDEYVILRISEISETTIKGSCISGENNIDEEKETVTMQKGEECSYEIGDFVLVNIAEEKNELRAEEIQNLTQEVLNKKYSTGVEITITDSEEVYISLSSGSYELKKIRGIYLYEFENGNLREITKDFMKDFRIQVEKSGHYLLGVINEDCVFEDMTASIIIESGFLNLQDLKPL